MMHEKDFWILEAMFNREKGAKIPFYYGTEEQDKRLKAIRQSNCLHHIVGAIKYYQKKEMSSQEAVSRTRILEDKEFIELFDEIYKGQECWRLTKKGRDVTNFVT